MRIPKKVVLAVSAMLCTLALICFFSRLWPLIALSSWQHGSQARMHCWVKVVDQEGKGVQGYKCRVVEEHAPLWLFSSGKDVVRVFETGDEGTFEYKSKGATGRVFFGYDVRVQWRMNPGHLMQDHCLGVTSIEHKREVQERPTGYLGSKEKPYLIQVFSVGSAQKLLFWKKRVRIENIGNYISVDLLSGRTWESKAPEGDVAMVDGQYTNEGAPQCAIRMVAGANCSLYPVVDDWGIAPPGDRYVKVLCQGKDWQDKRRKTYNTIQLYYRVEDRKVGRQLYGRLTLGLAPRVQGAELHSYTNLQGERNLYYEGYTDFDRNNEIRNFVSPPAFVERSEATAK